MIRRLGRAAGLAAPPSLVVGAVLAVILAVSLLTGGPVGEGVAVCCIGWPLLYLMTTAAIYAILTESESEHRS